MSDGKIVTVGVSPSWDITLAVDGIEWGQHRTVSNCTENTAGKALNVSKAMAYMGKNSTAAGLWGTDDIDKAKLAIREFKHIDAKLTAAPGRTRENVTVVDTVAGREMHLRQESELATPASLAMLKTDLETIVTEGDICVFSGSIPERVVKTVGQIMDMCRRRGARIVLDTSGPALRQLTASGHLWIIKPNVAELSQILGRELKNDAYELTKAGTVLLEKSQIVLISRGPEGAIAVTARGAWTAKAVEQRKVFSTVGCGDFLLAGFVEKMAQDSDIEHALRQGIRLAIVRAWAIADWKSAQEIDIRIEGMKTE